MIYTQKRIFQENVRTYVKERKAKRTKSYVKMEKRQIRKDEKEKRNIK